jgi:hypothetical protein
MPLKSKSLPPYQEVNKRLQIDSETGIITWRYSVANRVKPSDIVGTKNSNGYLHTRVNNKSYKLHRLAWLLYYQEDPGCYYIDHIDGNPLNNSKANLRKVTHKQNRHNTVTDNQPKSGFRGVDLLPSGRYRAYYGNKQLGTYNTGEEAKRVREDWLLENVGEHSYIKRQRNTHTNH